MANPLKARPFDQVAIDLRKAGLTDFSIRFLRDTLIRSDKVLTDAGAVQNVAPIVGRTEGIGTTVQHVDAGGVVTAPGVDFTRAYLNKNTDNIDDGTGTPLAGGKRGAIALDTNNRLANSFRGTAVNLSNTPASSTTLSNNGISTVINIAAATDNFAAGSISDNSGTVDPGVFGSFFVYHDDPTFAGGAVTYHFSAAAVDQTAAEGRIIDGKITTAGGSANTGGGSTGGTTPGGGGGRGYIEG